jgi:hypothetical protein
VKTHLQINITIYNINESRTDNNSDKEKKYNADLDEIKLAGMKQCVLVSAEA